MTQQARSRTRKRTKPQEQAVESTKRVTVVPFKDSDEEEVVEKDIHVFQSDPAYIRVSAGQTINMGDYESLRIDVALTMPCYPEMVDDTQAEVADWVANRLADEVDNYTGKGK